MRGRSAMGEGLQWFFDTIAGSSGGRSAMGEGLQYNTGSAKFSLRAFIRSSH